MLKVQRKKEESQNLMQKQIEKEKQALMNKKQQQGATAEDKFTTDINGQVMIMNPTNPDKLAKLSNNQNIIKF